MKQVEEYITQKKELQNIVLTFIDEEGDGETDLSSITNFIENKKIDEDSTEFKAFLELVLKISNNHHRSLNFFNKFEQILSFYSDRIKQIFSNNDIYNFFKSSSRILLFLFENKIITIDQQIADMIINEINTFRTNYKFYFYKEIKPFISEYERSEIEERFNQINPEFFATYEEKRLKGENDSFICTLIQNDSVEEFVSFVNQANLNLSSTIKPSIFETNRFLIKKGEVTLIEYAAFYGAYDIFNYLNNNNVELSPSLWEFVIHSQNADLIHSLEQNKVELKDKTIKNCIKEAIKCHHNNIAEYFINNLPQRHIKSYQNKCILFDEQVFDWIKYFNFEYFPTNFKKIDLFFHLCSNGYFKLVTILINSSIVKFANQEILFFVFIFMKFFFNVYK